MNPDEELEALRRFRKAWYETDVPAYIAMGRLLDCDTSPQSVLRAFKARLSERDERLRELSEQVATLCEMLSTQTLEALRAVEDAFVGFTP